MTEQINLEIGSGSDSADSDGDGGLILAIDDGEGGGFGIKEHADVVAIDELTQTPIGMAFGPLHFATPDGDTAVLERLEFLPEFESGGFLGVASVGVFGAAAVAHDDDDEHPVPRREFVVLIGAALGGAALSTAASADGDEFAAVEFELSRNDTVTKLSILDRVEAVLPPGVEYHIDHGGTRVDTLDPSKDDERGRFSVSGTGTFRVYVSDAMRFRDRIASWLAGLFSGPESVTFAFELSETAAEIAERDDPVEVLTTHPAVVTAMQDSGPGGAIMSIDDTSVAHEDERWSGSAGVYRVERTDVAGETRDALVYEASAEAPDSQDVELEVYAGRLATTRDAAGRLID